MARKYLGPPLPSTDHVRFHELKVGDYFTCDAAPAGVLLNKNSGTSASPVPGIGPPPGRAVFGMTALAPVLPQTVDGYSNCIVRDLDQQVKRGTHVYRRPPPGPAAPDGPAPGHAGAVGERGPADPDDA